MAYEEKKVATDPAFAHGQSNKGSDGEKKRDAGKVLAELDGHVLKARWEHPYPISAKQDDEELKRRKRK